MTTDIIVPIYDQLECTKMFLKSVEKQKNYHLILIDNGSENDTKNYLLNYSKGRENISIVRNDENLGYIKATNQGLKMSKSETILLANNDIILPNNLLDSLREGLSKFDIIAPLTNSIDSNETDLLVPFSFKEIQEIEDFASELKEKYYHQYNETNFVYGHCLLMKREVFEKVGLLDERYGMGNYDDLDYCKRAISKNFLIGVKKDCFVYHFCHTTFKGNNIDVEELIEENKKIFEKKWK